MKTPIYWAFFSIKCYVGLIVPVFLVFISGFNSYLIRLISPSTSILYTVRGLAIICALVLCVLVTTLVCKISEIGRLKCDIAEDKCSWNRYVLLDAYLLKYGWDRNMRILKYVTVAWFVSLFVLFFLFPKECFV
jgi:hypothetical protein